MPPLITSLLLLFSTTVWGQPDTTKLVQPKIDLIGIWTVTNFNKPDEFSDTWQFTADSIFSELKYLDDTSTTLAPDENGTWTVKRNLLTITATGEEANGKQVLYDEAQILKLRVEKVEKDIIITIISWGSVTQKDFPTLRLTRK